jgi:hypothetical protein
MVAKAKDSKRIEFGRQAGELTGHPSQEQPEPQPQEPLEAHPHPDMMMVD